MLRQLQHCTSRELRSIVGGSLSPGLPVGIQRLGMNGDVGAGKIVIEAVLPKEHLREIIGTVRKLGSGSLPVQ